MLRAAFLFLLIGVIAAMLGFSAIAGASFAIAKIIAGIFLSLLLIFLVMALFVTRAA